MKNNLITIPFKHTKRGEEEIIINLNHIQYIEPYGDDDYAVYFQCGDIQHIYISKQTFEKLKKAIL